MSCEGNSHQYRWVRTKEGSTANGCRLAGIQVHTIWAFRPVAETLDVKLSGNKTIKSKHSQYVCNLPLNVVKMHKYN